MSLEYEKDEYFALVKAIADSDQRLLTIKSWGVTLSLVALGLGFQHRAYGYFVVAAISSLAFWVLEHATRRHQMRHYVRMREIEVNRCEREPEDDRSISAPRIDWSWHCAKSVLNGDRVEKSIVKPRERNAWHALAFLMPHVALPHAFTFFAGLILVCLGLQDLLPGFDLGAAPSK